MPCTHLSDGAAPDGATAEKHEVRREGSCQCWTSSRRTIRPRGLALALCVRHLLSRPYFSVVTLWTVLPSRLVTPVQARIQELNNKLERTRDTHAKLVAANEAYAKSARKVASAERRLQDQEATARKASSQAGTRAASIRPWAAC